MIKTAQVVFGSSNAEIEYDFKTDLDLEIGDLVVCHARSGFKIVKVVGVLDYVTSRSKAWIVDKVDIDRHRKILAEEQELKDLKIRMEERTKQLLEIKQFEELADEDADMRELVKEFKELSK